MNFSTINQSGTVEGFAIIKNCDKKTTQRGAVYLDMMLSDKDGTINAKLWDYTDDMNLLFPANTLVKVRGQITQFNGSDQLKIDRIRKADDSDGIDIKDFVPTADYTSEFMLSEIRKIIDAFEDNDLKALTNEIINSKEKELLYFPAAYKLHHAFRGGLLMHTLSIVRLAQRVCEVYPFVNKDLLLSGAILHDIAKTEEFDAGETGIASGYTVKGELIGHLVRGAMIVEKAAEKLGIPEEKKMLLEHMLISHHGVPEYGAAVMPRTLEAELLSDLDSMDATVFEIISSVSQIKTGEFSPRQWALDDRKFYNHSLSDYEEKTNLD